MAGDHHALGGHGGGEIKSSAAVVPNLTQEARDARPVTHAEMRKELGRITGMAHDDHLDDHIRPHAIHDGETTEHLNDRPFDDPLPESMEEPENWKCNLCRSEVAPGCNCGREGCPGQEDPHPDHQDPTKRRVDVTTNWSCEKCNKSCSSGNSMCTKVGCPGALELPPARELNPKDAEGVKRVPMNLLPTAGKIAQALAHLDGAEKYGVENWRDIPVGMMGMLAAIERHIERLKSGQDHDSKSKVHHLGHIMASAAILLDAQEAGTMIDDRPCWDQANNASESDMLDRANKFLEERTPNIKVAPSGIGRDA